MAGHEDLLRLLKLQRRAFAADPMPAKAARTVSGGVTVNDCLWHFAQEDLPFGGVGASGIGAYHGEAGFRTFSKDKPVFFQSRLNGMFLMRPPYGRAFERVVALLRRLA